MTNDGTFKYEFNTERMMTRVRNAGTNAIISDYLYDPALRQRQKNVGGTKTNFYYAGWQRLADYEATAGTPGTLLNRYVYGTGLDEVLIQITSGGTKTYYHGNHQGSIVATTNSSGNVVNRYKYSPFGESPSVSGTTHGYTGQRFDSETGLYYYKMRYYSPKLGRFLQADPIGYGDGMNVYSYVGSAPVSSTDSLGLAGGSSGGGSGAASQTYTYWTDLNGVKVQMFYSLNNIYKPAKLSGRSEVIGDPNGKNPFTNFNEWLENKGIVTAPFGDNNEQGAWAERLVQEYLRTNAPNSKVDIHTFGLSVPNLFEDAGVASYPDLIFTNKNTGQVGTAFGEVKSAWNKMPSEKDLSWNQRNVYPMVYSGASTLFGPIDPNMIPTSFEGRSPYDFPTSVPLDYKTPVYGFYINISDVMLTAWAGGIVGG